LEPKGGAYHNFVMKNVVLQSGNKHKPQNSWSYLLDGDFSNFRFVNLVIDCNSIVKTNEDYDKPAEGSLWFVGDKSALSFDTME
jgi:hypothetical protein